MRLRWLSLLLVLVLFAPVAGDAVTGVMSSGDAAWPLGASASPPDQRDATAGSGRPGEPLPVAARSSPPPPGAVPGRAELPEIRRHEPERRQARPEARAMPKPGAGEKTGAEDLAARTERSQTFVNPDGTRTLRMHTDDVHVRQRDGAWAPVDRTLVAAQGVLRAKSANEDVRFGGGGSAELTFDGQNIVQRWENAANVLARADGTSAIYADVLPGAELKSTTISGGFRQDLVLSGPTRSVSSTMRLNGLEPRLDDGVIVLTDKAGEVRARYTVPEVADAAGVTSTAELSVEKAGDAWRVRSDLDEGWLNDAQRKFPVTMAFATEQVDAATRIDASADDRFVRAGTSGSLNLDYLDVGRVQGHQTARSYLRFPLATALRNKYVVGATVNVWNVLSEACAPPRAVSVFEVTQGWSAGSLKWPGAAVGPALSTASFAHGQGCGAPNWGHLPIHGDHVVKFSQWTHGIPFHGLSLRATNEADARSGKRLGSADLSTQGKPYLDVVYSNEGASYQIDGLTLPTNAHPGEIRAKVRNLGESVWPAGGGFRLGFTVRRLDGSVVTTSQGVGPVATVPLLATGEFVVPMPGVQPGRYNVELTMFDPQGRSFRDTHSVPSLEFPMEVHNLPPTTNRQEPAHGAPVESSRPTLFAAGVDADKWPDTGFKYRFKLCADTEMTKECRESPDWGPQTWAPKDEERLRWSTTYHWSVKVHDNASESNWIGPFQFTTRVPQPQITAHLGGTVADDAPGLSTQVGNYTATATDADIATAGPDLTITRTYNSLDPRRDTAFGIGWSSRLDMRMQEDKDGSGSLVITYPTGRQVRVGRNPDVDGKRSYAPPPGQNVTLGYDSASGEYTLRDSTGSRWIFDARLLLVRIIDADGLSERLRYVDGKVSVITNDVSRRDLQVTWNDNHVRSVRTAPVEAGGQPLVWTYEHVGDKLMKACAPDQTCTSYEYETGSHYRSGVMDDEPRGYWRLAEVEGDLAANAAARNDGADPGRYHGVVLGTAGAVGGTADKAAAFDGTSSHVTLPEGLANDTMSASVELWFKTASHGVLVSYADQSFPNATKNSTPVLYVGTDGLLYGGFATRDYGEQRQVVSDIAVDDGKWHHAVLSASVNKQSMYVDGQLKGEVGGIIDHDNRKHMVLGAGSGKDWPATNGENFFFEGEIDEFAVYRHPLGELAAKAHHALGQPIDRLTKVVLPQDKRIYTQLTYDDIQDRVRAMTDHSGRQWTLDTPKMSERKEGEQTISRRTVALHGPNAVRTYTFDPGNNGRIVQRDENGRVRKYEYNAKDFSSAVIDENGHRVERFTDDRGNVISTKSCRTKDACHATYATYIKGDPLDPRTDKLETSSDARSTDAKDTRFRTTYTYDAQGRTKTTTSPGPQGSSGPTVETFTYATGTEAAIGGGTVPAGLLIKATGKRDQATIYGYRANGDLEEQTEPSGLRTKFGYDAIGRKKSVTLTNAIGAMYGTTTYTYTPRSQIDTITEPGIVNPVTGVTHTKVTKNRYDGNGNILETTLSDATGGTPPRTTLFGYDEHDRLVKTTYPDGGEQTTSYLDDGYTHVLTDVRGFKWTSQYDERELLVARTISGQGVDPDDAENTVLTLETRQHDNAGRLTWITDAMGRRTTYGYYDDGLLATTTRNGYVGPDGKMRDVVLERRGYDPAGNVTESVAAGGATTINEYDPAGFVTKTTFDPGGLKRVTTYTRDRNGNAERVALTGPVQPGRTEVTRYKYDNANLVIQEIGALADGVALPTTYERDERGLVREQTDRRNRTTTYDYDLTGRVVTMTSPPTDIWVNGTRTEGFAAKETLGRNAYGEVTHARNAAGTVTRTDYDVMGRTSMGIQPDYTPPGGQPIRNATTTTEYDKAGNPTKITDPLNRITVNTYDPYGRVATKTHPKVGNLPSVETFRYNANGELRTHVTASGAQTHFTYDELGRRITETAVDRYPTLASYKSVIGYDDAGNVTSRTTPQGFTSFTEYNAAGEPKKHVDATSRVTTFVPDDAGRTIQVTDPTGLTTVTDYDLLGRQTAVRHRIGGADKRVWLTEPDENGNVVETISPEGRRTTSGYDALNRLVSRTEEADATTRITVSLGYDHIGNRSRFVDGENRVTTYTHNAWGLQESVVEPGGATWTTSYDAGAQPVRMVQPGNVVREATYDAQGRVKLEKGSGAEAPTADRVLDYDADGRLTKVGGPRGDSTYRYDDRGNVIATGGAAGDSTFAYHGDGHLAVRTDASGRATFEYDRAGRLAIVNDPLTSTVSYGYDDGGRLKTVTGTGISRTMDHDELSRVKSDKVGQYGVTYTYDNDDKLKTKTTGTATNQYGYDGAGRLRSWTDASNKTTEYGYDRAGNRTSAGGVTYTYDERNRLKSGAGSTYEYSDRGTLRSITQNGQTRQLTFDAFDRMLSHGGVTYRYDAKDRVADRNGIAFQYAGLTNDAVTDGTRLTSRLPDGTALSDKAIGGQSGLVYSDIRGDAVARYNGATVTGMRAFDPFGTTLLQTGENASDGYQGDWSDAETGAVNMSARWYQPGTGTFASRDDWNNPPEPTPAANRYAYGNNDPMANTDPTGHFTQCVHRKPVRGVGGAVRTVLRWVPKLGRWVPHPVVRGIATGIDIMMDDECNGTVRLSRRFPPKGDNSGSAAAADRRILDSMPPGGTTTDPGVRPPLPPLPPIAPPDVVPPPPPPWLVFLYRIVSRPWAGNTVRMPRKFTKVDLPPEVIQDKGQKYVDEVHQVTHWTNSPDVQQFPTDNSDDEQDCVNGDMPHTIWYGPLDSKKRATGANACLTMVNPDDRGHMPSLDGFKSGKDYVNARAHLIGHVFFGVNAPQNLVPFDQDQGNNAMMYHRVEDRIKKRIERGERFYYQVRPVYDDGDASPQDREWDEKRDKNMAEQVAVGMHIVVKGKNYSCDLYLPNTRVRPDNFQGCPA